MTTRNFRRYLTRTQLKTQQKLAEYLNLSQKTISRSLQAMENVYKLGKWAPCNLNERQMENRKLTCEVLLQRHERRSFLHWTVTGDEKSIYFENPKRRKS